MKALGLLIVLVALAMGQVNGLAQLRTKRPLAAAAVVAVPAAPVVTQSADVTVADESEESEPAMVQVSATSEADETTEDGSNDDSGAEDNERAPEMPIHEHFRQFTTPMELLPVEFVESAADSATKTAAKSGARADDDAEGKGSNPTYILPVDPFNYFPFFNGFSNVNPFSQFYPPAPYLYPQHTNYMHRYANHPMPPYASGAHSYGGHWNGHGHGGMYAGHGGGWGGGGYPHPHMSYPFGAYKMDVSGPDVRTGSNNPPPFPQFSEMSSELITPEIIPKAKDAEDVAADEAEDVAEADRVAQPVQLEVTALEEQQHMNDLQNEEQAQADASDEFDSADESEDAVEAEEAFETEGEEAVEAEEAAEGELEADSEDEHVAQLSSGDADSTEVEFQEESEAEEGGLSAEGVEFTEEDESDSATDEEGNMYNAAEVEYA